MSLPCGSLQDVVLLQEVWVEQDAKLLLECGKAGGLVHGMHFKTGMLGSGLVTMSRFPIQECAVWQFAAAGDPAAFSCGDFYASKGKTRFQSMLGREGFVQSFQMPEDPKPVILCL